MRCFIIFKINDPPPPAQQILYNIDLYCPSIYTIYVSGKLGHRGEGGWGAILSKPKKMRGQNSVWKKYTKMTLKMRSRSHNHRQIFASCHLWISVQHYYKYIIATNFCLASMQNRFCSQYLLLFSFLLHTCII